MATSLEITNGLQSLPVSFTLNFPQIDSEKTTNDRQRSQISFSLNLPKTDRTSLEKPKREDLADVNYDTDFEFCVNGQNPIIGETMISAADELFVDGKILPLTQGPVEVQPVAIARHVSVESSRPLSPVRSTSSPSSKIRSSCWGNFAFKSLRHKPPSKCKDMMFKANKKKNSFAEKIRTLFKVVNQSQPSSTKSLLSCLRSCRTGGEMKGNDIFRSLPFSASQSKAERKHKAATSGCTSQEIETELSGLIEGSKLVEASNISNKVQSASQHLGELKPRLEAEDGKEKTKVKQTSGKLVCPGVPASRIRGDMSGQWTTGRVGGNGRLMAGILERSSSTVAKAARLDSPPPGRPMAEGSLVVKANNYMGGVRVSPVLNVPVCTAYSGGRRNGGGFSKRDNKSAY